MQANEQFVVHTKPVWKNRSDFVINAEISDGPSHRFEQLIVKKLDDDKFQLCCIPFFLYDVSLGDVVRTVATKGRQYLFSRVIRPSGRFVFRVWFGDSFYPRNEVAEMLVSLGALLEWSSTNLIAVDAADAAAAQQVADLLNGLERQGKLIYETGRRESS